MASKSERETGEEEEDRGNERERERIGLISFIDCLVPMDESKPKYREK